MRTFSAFAVIFAAAMAIGSGPAVAVDGSAHAGSAGRGPVDGLVRLRPAEPLDAFDVTGDLTAAHSASPVGSSVDLSALHAAAGPDGVVELDPVTGTPRFVGDLGGYLTPPSDASPGQTALRFIREHADAFGLTPGQIDALHETRDYTDAGGTTHLAWEQRVEGVPVYEHGVIANVGSDGRLINVMGAPVPAPGAIRTVDPAIRARTALSTALDDAGAPRTPPAVSSRTAAGLTRFDGGDTARPYLFPAAPGSLQLAWRVTAQVSSTAIYDYFIDASTGEVLRRENTVDSAAGSSWEYAPQIDQACDGECLAAAGQQTLHIWPGDWGTVPNRLEGDNVHVYTDVDDDDRPDGAIPGCSGLCGEIPPSSPNIWDYPFQANPYPGRQSSSCLAVFPQCSWAITTDGSHGFGWLPNLRQGGTQVYYYVNRFHDWLAGAPFGFTSAAGAFDGDDKVNAEILDGADTDTQSFLGTPDTQHINNANMVTPADGKQPRMQMYLWANASGRPTPETNAGDDASLVYHEYTHGLSHRLVLDANGNPGLSSFQANAMGEGWSDWYALDFLESHDYMENDTTDAGEMNLGFYAAGGDIHNLRTEGADCPVGSADSDCPGGAATGSGGYTLGDMGKVIDGPEVHADGEIWAQTLWDLRRSGLTPDQVRTLITRGMELSPPGPSMLEMRNAILQAAKVNGIPQSVVWDVFAGRGMGFFAYDGGGDDISPTEDFSTPPDCAAIACGSITGTVTEKGSRKPVAGALVTLEGAAGLFAKTNGKGKYTIANLPPHTYPSLTMTAPGYNPLTVSGVQVGTGSRSIDFNPARDWLAVDAGAKVTKASKPDLTDFGCGPEQAFDLSLASGWGSTSLVPADPSAGPGGKKSAVVKLPKAVDVTSFGVDPGATCGDDDTASTRKLEIEVSRDGKKWTSMGTEKYGQSAFHRLNTVKLSRRQKRAAMGIRYVRVTMLGSLSGTGSGSTYMDLSEVQAYGKQSGLQR